MPVKDQPNWTISPTTTSTKGQSTTAVPLKDQTSSTTLPAKDQTTTSEVFLSSAAPAKDQTTTTTSVPLKDQTSSTILPAKDKTITSEVFFSTNLSAKDQTTTTTSVSLKDQTSSTILPTKDGITTSEVFFSTTLPAKDQTSSTSVPLKNQTSGTTLLAKEETRTSHISAFSSLPIKDKTTSFTTKEQTTAASVPLKDQTSTTVAPTKEETSTSHGSIFSSIPTKDKTTSSTITLKDENSTSTVSFQERTTASSLFASTLLSTKDKITSSTILLKDQTSTSTTHAKDETMVSVGESSTVPVNDKPTSTSLLLKDQTITSFLPTKDKATVTSGCSSTTLLLKDQVTSSSVSLKLAIFTYTVPGSNGTKISSTTTSSITIPAKDKTTSTTILSKDDTGISSVASKDVKASVLTVTALPSTTSISTTSKPSQYKGLRSSSSAKDETISSLTKIKPPFDNLTATVPSKDQGSSVSSQPAKDDTLTSLAAIATTVVLSLVKVSESLAPTPSVSRVKDEPAITTSFTRSLAFYKNVTTTGTTPYTDLSPLSVNVFPSTTYGESMAHAENGGNSTLSLFSNPIESSQKDKTLTLFSPSGPLKYFPGLTSSQVTSLPPKDLPTSLMFSSIISQISAAANTLGMLPTLPTVSTVVVPFDYTLGLIPSSSTSPKIKGGLQGAGSTVTAPVVFTLGLFPLSGMNSSESREKPVSFISTIPAVVETVFGPSTNTITPVIVLTVTKSAATFTSVAHSPSEVYHTISPLTMSASIQGMSSSEVSPVISLPSSRQNPSTSSSISTYVSATISVEVAKTSGLTPIGTLLSSLRAFNSTIPFKSAISLSFILPPAQSVVTKYPSSVLAGPTLMESKMEPSTVDRKTSDAPIPQPTESSTMIPLYTPGLLGNAYGGGYITTPSIYVVVTASPVVGVPPGYGYSVGPEGTTIILSTAASSISSPLSGETLTLPTPETTGLDVSGIAQPSVTSTAGNASFLAPSHPSSPTTFQGSANNYGVALLTLLLGLLLGFLIH